MKNNQCLGLIFPNVHDNRMFEMTEHRSIGSVPFASRYRLIDFSLSMMVNAGITKVGVLARSNYRSLMDHLGNGKPWDLSRKNGGLCILPPFNTSTASVGPDNTAISLFGNSSFII